MEAKDEKAKKNIETQWEKHVYVTLCNYNWKNDESTSMDKLLSLCFVRLGFKTRLPAAKPGCACVKRRLFEFMISGKLE